MNADTTTHGPSTPTVADEAVRPPTTGHPNLSWTALVVQPYRNDHGQHRWVFRCWGANTCDGCLSLDHFTESAATSARDRHITEAHPELVSTALRKHHERAQLLTTTLTEVLTAFRAVTDNFTRTLVGYVSDPIHPTDMDRWQAAVAHGQNRVHDTLEEPPSRLLGCGWCYEEQGEEVHPHPECPIGGGTVPTADFLVVTDHAETAAGVHPATPNTGQTTGN
ncbi:hypothetical protein [Streptomyces sp. NPDC051554]|uniref:hypothetical protein n=1 Tax=Streptomyces sp. NPDC051554 TaxID=3365656 RepID=UPI00378B6AFB